jgi:predicted RNase H-like HicB family nuclease
VDCISFRERQGQQVADAEDRRVDREVVSIQLRSLRPYKVVLYRQDDGSWVAEVPALGGCYALMDTREAALTELQHVFALIAQEHQDRGPLTSST